MQLCPTLRPHGLESVRLLCPWNSPGRNTGVGSHSLLQGIFLTQGSKLRLQHCRQILYYLSCLQPKGQIQPSWLILFVNKVLLVQSHSHWFAYGLNALCCNNVMYLGQWPSVQFSSVTQLSNSLRSHGLQHTRLACPSPTPETCSNSCPSSRWWDPIISFSVVPFVSCLQSFPASGSFPESVLRISGQKY